MNLYHIQDADRPTYVLAKDYPEAIERWKALIAKENGWADSEQEEPDGATLVARKNDIILPDFDCVPTDKEKKPARPQESERDKLMREAKELVEPGEEYINVEFTRALLELVSRTIGIPTDRCQRAWVGS